jgi:uncharacterized protein YecT (DUF1311 family)
VWPAPALAIDCGKASTTIEKVICGDPALKALDGRMSAAYAEVRKSLSAKDRKALADSQRKWLVTRDQCEDETDAKTAACLREKMEERRSLLAGEPVSGPGTGSRMIPVFIQQEGSKTQYAVDFSLMRFAAPKSRSEKLFNGKIDELAETAPLGPHGQDLDLEVPLESIASVTVSYASPRLLSAAIDVWSFDGGAHGNGVTSNVNIDLGRGAFLKSADIFPAPAFGPLKEDCKAQIFEKKREGIEGEYNPAEDSTYSDDTVTAYMKDLDQWHFFADRAVVTFDAYEIGSYAEGPYECEFPMAKLKALAKPGAPLPE